MKFHKYQYFLRNFNTFGAVGRETFIFFNENQLFELQPAPEEPSADGSSQEEPGGARSSQKQSGTAKGFQLSDLSPFVPNTVWGLALE